MFKVKKRIEISSSHSLDLDYGSKCENIHGHNWIIEIFCKSEELNRNGMVIDFSEIKKEVMKLDHKNLNEILVFNPTAENIAKYLCCKINKCYKVTIKESENNLVEYEEDYNENK